MAFTYAGDPSASDVAAVRFEIQDTDSTSPLLQDAEIAWCILDETKVAPGTPATITGANLYRAAARCMEALTELFAAQADSQVGSLKVTYSAQAEQYAARAAEKRKKAADMHAPTAGGITHSGKQAAEQDRDRIRPAFRRGQFRNPWTGGGRGFDDPDLGPQQQ